MNNFKFWMEEIADMPEQMEDGSWVDLETGLPFDPESHYKTGGTVTRWKPSEDLKENRKVARFYDGKALTGTAKQKEWAEKLRADVLRSDELSDEQKTELLAVGAMVKTAKFWINNKNVEKSYFIAENLIREFNALMKLKNSHYDVLARSGLASKKDSARNEITAQLKANKFQIKIDFPNFDPYK